MQFTSLTVETSGLAEIKGQSEGEGGGQADGGRASFERHIPFAFHPNKTCIPEESGLLTGEWKTKYLEIKLQETRTKIYVGRKEGFVCLWLNVPATSECI